MDSAQGTDVHTYRWAYARNGYNIDGQMHPEWDADSVTAWDGAHGDSMIVHLVRTPRYRWAIESSDGPLPLTAYRQRFHEPSDVLDYVGKRWGVVFREAVCRCGEPGGECDD